MCPTLLASRPPRSNLLEQLEGGGDTHKLESPALSGSFRTGGGRLRVVTADRGFLATGRASEVLLHDYRDTRFLKRVSAVGVCGTLMSCSAVAYAVAFGLGSVSCGGLVLQAMGAGVCLTWYLRTYVARASLDSRRARLALTCCGLFGEALSMEQYIPLHLIEPGVSVEKDFIKFRLRGPFWNPNCWIWYRIPRAQDDGRSRAPGAQVGYRPDSTSRTTCATSEGMPVSLARGAADTNGTSSAPRRFSGAGLGAGPSGFEGSVMPPLGPAMPMPAATKARAEEEQAQSETSATAHTAQKSLSGLKLLHGLPLNSMEEQKIIDFFEDPTAYATVSLRV